MIQFVSSKFCALWPSRQRQRLNISRLLLIHAYSLSKGEISPPPFRAVVCFSPPFASGKFGGMRRLVCHNTIVFLLRGFPERANAGQFHKKFLFRRLFTSGAMGVFCGRLAWTLIRVLAVKCNAWIPGHPFGKTFGKLDTDHYDNWEIFFPCFV